mmetsp:Transcript_15528/g.37152  ORF Transcript_15528/g.37152 Transcript_15528/m.37152 type:complete len:204 (+) Transcript_15528:383-994(+)
MRPTLGSDNGPTAASAVGDAGNIRKDAVHHAPIHYNVPCQTIERINDDEDDHDLIHLSSLHWVIESLLVGRHTKGEQTRRIFQSIQQMLISFGIVLPAADLVHDETLPRTAHIRPTRGHTGNDDRMDAGRYRIGIVRRQMQQKAPVEEHLAQTAHGIGHEHIDEGHGTDISGQAEAAGIDQFGHPRQGCHCRDADPSRRWQGR